MTADTHGTAELFARSYAGKVDALYRSIQRPGVPEADQASELWARLAHMGWTPGELRAAGSPYAGPDALDELEARHADLQEWGDIAPPRRPLPAARRNIGGAVWTGATWAQSTEGERWPMPLDVEWVRLRRASPGQITKVYHLNDAGEWEAKRDPPPTWFKPETIVMPNDVAACADLLHAWDRDDGALLVRGVLACNPDGRGRVRRTLRGTDATLAPHPIGRRVIVCDFDKLDPADLGLPDWPGAERWPTVDEAAAFVRAAIVRLLPESFHRAAAAYRWSSSTGVPGGKRGPLGWSRPSCHVVFVVDRPVHDESLELWLEGKADKSVATSEHALYLSPPVFVGAPPPTWPEGFDRVGLLDGAAEVVTPGDLYDGEEWALRCELAAIELRAEELRRRREAQRARVKRERESLDSRLQRTAASGPPKSTLDRARAWLTKREPAVEGQGGDRHTFVTCCQMVRDFELSEADALEALTDWNATCRPPWGDDDLRQKIAAAAAYGTGAMGAKIEGDTHHAS